MTYTSSTDSQVKKTLVFEYIHTEWNGKRKVPVSIKVEIIATYGFYGLEFKSADIEQITIGDSKCLYNVLEQTNFELLESIKEAAEDFARSRMDEPMQDAETDEVIYN